MFDMPHIVNRKNIKLYSKYFFVILVGSSNKMKLMLRWIYTHRHTCLTYFKAFYETLCS